MRAWTDDPAPIFETVSEIGYDGVELSLLGVSLDRAAEIRGQAASRGLALTCSTGLGPDADPTSADPAVRARAVAVLTEAIRTTSAMGASSLAGVVAAPWGVFDPENKEARAERSAQTLAKVDAVLDAEGVTLGIEAINRFETDLTSTASDACAIARATGSRHIGVLLDSFHMNIEEKNPPEAIRAAGDTLVHFHISENDRGRPGSGRYNFRADAAALKEIGYAGWIVAEMFVMAGHASSRDLNIWRDIEPDPTQAAAEALRYMKEVFSDVG